MDASTRLRIFISYARGDAAALAEELMIGLELLGFDPILDKHDIAAAEDWEQRLESLLRQADTVVFLLSPRSVGSRRCAWEVDKASALSKRIVPVVAAPVSENDVPPLLRKLNFIDFGPGQSFARALGRLADALRVDLDWIREHTRLAELAGRWLARGQDDALLLRGAELAGSQAWATCWHAGAPEITDDQRRYITHSTEASAQRENLERQRLDELAHAVAEQAQALTLREAATRQLRRRTVAGGVAGAVLSAGMGTLGYMFVREARELERMRSRADEAAALALKEAVQREAMRTDLEGQVFVSATSSSQVGYEGAGFTKNLLAEMASDQVSLSLALARTVHKVLAQTNGRQRPFIATDMNGDVYLRLAPPSRRRRALVITVDHIDHSTQLPGVRLDGQAWSDFLGAAGFELQWLRNPKREDVMLALLSMQVSSAAIPPAMFKRVGAAAAASGLGGRSDSDPEAPKPPPPNSFCLLYFAGPSIPSGDRRFLALDDTPLLRAREDSKEVRRSVVAVDELSAILRERFAASCFVADV